MKPARKIRVGLVAHELFGGMLVRACQQCGPEFPIELKSIADATQKWQTRLPNNYFIHKFGALIWYAVAITSALTVDVVCFLYVDNPAANMNHVCKILGKKVIYFWIGSDVYGELKHRTQIIKSGPQPDIHIACAQNLIDELESLGAESELVYVPVSLPPQIAKMPDKHAVLLSIPDDRAEFYGKKISKQLICDFPDVDFHIVRSSRPDWYEAPNVVFHGVVSHAEMDSIYDKISIAFRFPEHDSTSMFLSEALMKGKYLISRFAFPHAEIVNSYEEAADALRDVLKKPLVPDAFGHELALSEFGAKKNTARFVRCVQKLFSATRKFPSGLLDEPSDTHTHSE